MVTCRLMQKYGDKQVVIDEAKMDPGETPKKTEKTNSERSATGTARPAGSFGAVMGVRKSIDMGREFTRRRSRGSDGQKRDFNE